MTKKYKSVKILDYDLRLNLSSHEMGEKLVKDDTSKVVLGQPFSGALYAYFDYELNKGRNLNRGSPYHDGLFGKNFERYVDLALTLCLIYDNIILVSSGTDTPDDEKYSGKGEYYNPEFGLYYNWNDEYANCNYLIPKSKELLKDSTILRLLSSIPRINHDLVLEDSIREIRLAEKFNATLFTSGKRQAIVKRILEIEKKQLPQEEAKTKVNIIKTYLEITGLLFEPMKIDSFYYLKTEKELRLYANSFITILNEFVPQNENKTRQELLYLIKNSIESDKLHSKISGIFKNSSSIMNYIGLVPFLGTAAGLTGIGTDLTSKGIDKINEKNKWYQLAAHTEKIVSKEKIDRELKKLK